MTFDWTTFIFQVFNFLVLVFLLWRLLWRPIRRHMSERAERIAAELDSVEAGRREVTERAEEAAKALAEARAVRDRALTAAKREAEERRTELLGEAKAAAAAERRSALQRLRAERDRLEAEFIRGLDPLVGRVVGRVLEELGGDDLHRLACGRLARSLDELSAEEREALGADPDAELVLARDELPTELTAALARLGLEPSVLPRRVDEELLAGAILRTSETLWDGSLVGQIRRVRGAP